MTDRRRFLAAAAATGLAGMSIRARSAASHRPPVAKRVPVFDDYYGTTVADPYRWMEDAQDPDLLPWLKAQDAFTREALAQVPGAAKFRARVGELSGELSVIARLDVAGGRLFFEQQPAGAQNYKLFVKDETGSSSILIDPTVLTIDGGHVSLDWWEPSPDGRRVVYGLSRAGSEASTAHVIDVGTGRILDERIPDTDFGATGWLPDGSGFFYIQLTGKRGTTTIYKNSVVKLHIVDSDPAADRIVLKRGMYEQLPMTEVQIGEVRPIRGSDRAVIMVRDIRPERAVWTALVSDLMGDRAPKFNPVSAVDDLVVSVAATGDDLFLVSNRDAPRGRVLRTSVATPSLSSAKEVVPQSRLVAESVYPVAGGALLRLMDAGVQRLSRVTRDGVTSAVRLPYEGSVTGVFTSEVREDAYVSLTGWLQPRAIWHLGVEGIVRDSGLDAKPPFDLSPYTAERRFARARDGTKVPYTIVARRGWRPDAANPVFAAAYGAYQHAFTPVFQARLLAFLDSGGVYVAANVRGGGEYGREWHKAGQKATKHNTWRDFIDVSKALIATRVTSPRHLVIEGTSAGGIAVGRALTERPDLFAGAVANAGWMNPLRYVAEPNIADIDEWGEVVDAASFRIMHDMDSYQAIRDGVRYPAVLITCGINDPRVATFNAAKFGARLQAATASDAPVLIRVDFNAGHGMGSTRAQRDALVADIFTFALWRAGARGFVPKA